MSPNYIVLIPCAGGGSRFGSDVPKQYTEIGNKTVLEYTINAFLAVPKIEQIIIVASKADRYIDFYTKLSPKIYIQKVGGETRAESVLNGLQMIECQANDWILVHDAARCCITVDLIENMIAQLANEPVGGILAIPATDTLKLGNNGIISKTLDRSVIYLAQTPQMFRYEALLKSLTIADLAKVTDEASAVEQLGLDVHLVEGSASNIKLTYSSDVYLAKMFLGV